MIQIETLAIIGVGLIGSSLAQAIRQSKQVQVHQIIGFCRNFETAQAAQAAGVIDHAANNYDCLAQADVVCIATTLNCIAKIFQEINPVLPPTAIVTDVASVKQSVIDSAQATLTVPQQFVPGHPIAGSERSGWQAGDGNLFQNKPVVLCPSKETSPQAVTDISALWQACGATVHTLQASTHDSLFAGVSHLPHILAYAALNVLGTEKDADMLFALSGTGFKDFSRIAASQPELWAEICDHNRAQLLPLLDRYQQELHYLQRILQQPVSASLDRKKMLQDYFTQAQKHHTRLNTPS